MTPEEDYFESRLKIIEKKLDELLCYHPSIPHAALFEAARYSVLAPAKRLRPLFVLATAEMFNPYILEKAIVPACAIEMLHTYSLIHDDLPCMDDDDLRRGRPTLHKVFPEGHAVLTGDFLLTYAFQLISEAEHLSSEQKMDLIQVLSKSAGSEGMIGGQVVDLELLEKPLNLKILEFLHLNKTAALFSCCLESGAIIADCSKEKRTALQEAGKKIGFAFQLIDDILDQNKNEKASALPLLGIEGTKNYAKKLLEETSQLFATLNTPTDLLCSLVIKLSQHLLGI
jgi:geranylgeranyl diphosphate synthase type II